MGKQRPIHQPVEEHVLEVPLMKCWFFAKQFLHGITRPDVVRMRAMLIGESPRFPDLATQFYEQGPQRTLNHLAQFFARLQKVDYFVAMDPHFLAEQFLSALRSERTLQLGLNQRPTKRKSIS
jgi:hypothetical protein